MEGLYTVLILAKRSISTFALLLTSVSAIIGSGWLFSAYYSAELAGPASLVAWLIGGAAVMLIAFVFAELCAMLPITGSSTRIPQFTHGTLVSFLFSWIIWLTYAAIVPTETQAVIQYVSFYFPFLVHSNAGLTHYGYAVAIILMLLISAINVFSLRWLLRCNNILTLMKVVIPVLIALFIIIAALSQTHSWFPRHSSFSPYGFHGIFSAIATGGIVFAFNGFKQACEMAGEAKNPNHALPIAIIGSVLICLIIYILLQLAFLASVTQNNLIHGWMHLDLLSSANSPVSAMLEQDQLSFLMPILYLCAIIGPLAAGLMYMSSASRSLFGMSQNGQVPSICQRLTAQGNPIVAIGITFILGMCFFAPLPGWERMITLLTSLMALTYGVGPICFLTLRKQVPSQKRPFRLPFGTLWASIAFYICTLLTYWSGWEVLSKLGITLLIGLAVLFINRFIQSKKEHSALHWRASIWMWPYLAGIMLLSYIGTFGGGLGILPFGWDLIAIAVFCIIIIKLALTFTLPAEETKRYIQELQLHAE